MSTTNTAAYCETADVQEAMQEADANFEQGNELETANVEAAIFAASRWLRATSGNHWYDSNAAAGDLVSTSPSTETGALLDVPSATHSGPGQLFADREHGLTRYPRTTLGSFARVRLPKHHVQRIDALNVADPNAEETDWVADPAYTQGRHGDYFLENEGDARGRSYLYVDAGGLGARHRYEDVLRVDMSYGQDWDTEPWDDVRRGVAQLAAAELVTDDNVLASIPDNGSLINVETQAQQFVTKAMQEPGYLAAYIPTHPVA